MNRLFWARRSDGGILCVAHGYKSARTRAHAELCGCSGPIADCPELFGATYRVTDIERELKGWRIALVPRAPAQYDVVRTAGSTELWWVYADDGPGEWYALRYREEAVEAFLTAHREQRGRHGLHVHAIRCVDGYEVLLVRETASVADTRREVEEAIG